MFEGVKVVKIIISVEIITRTTILRYDAIGVRDEDILVEVVCKM